VLGAAGADGAFAGGAGGVAAGGAGGVAAGGAGGVAAGVAAGGAAGGDADDGADFADGEDAGFVDAEGAGSAGGAGLNTGACARAFAENRNRTDAARRNLAVRKFIKTTVAKTRGHPTTDVPALEVREHSNVWLRSMGARRLEAPPGTVSPDGPFQPRTSFEVAFAADLGQARPSVHL
jgi:hypothetical protein